MAAVALMSTMVVGIASNSASATQISVCNYVLYISQSVAAGGLGGGYVDIGSQAFISGSFIENDSSLSPAITSLSGSLAYVNFVNSTGVAGTYAGWLNVETAC